MFKTHYTNDMLVRDQANGGNFGYRGDGCGIDGATVNVTLHVAGSCIIELYGPIFDQEASMNFIQNLILKLTSRKFIHNCELQRQHWTN